MTTVPGESRDERQDDEQPPAPQLRMYKPDAHAVWPTYPPGTMLPIPAVRRGLKVACSSSTWVLLPAAAIAGAVFGVMYIRHLTNH